MFKHTLAAILVATLSSAAFAGGEAAPQKSGHYMGIKWESQDGKSGGVDANTYGLTLGKKLSDNLSAEIYTRIKDADNTTNNTRLEGAVIGTMPLAGTLSAYARVGVGEKFVSGDNYSYWTAEPGLKLGLTDDLSVKAGVRWRDSFQTNHNQWDRTYKLGVGYKLTANTAVGVDYKVKRGDSEYDAVGVGYKVSF